MMPHMSLKYFGSRMVSLTDVGNLAILLLNLETFQPTQAIFLPKAPGNKCGNFKKLFGNF